MPGPSSPWCSRIATRGCSDTFEQFSTCLNDADVAIIAPVYAAGEEPIAGIDRDSYAESLARARPSPCPRDRRRRKIWPQSVADVAKPGGAIVCLGAGSITGWAAGLEAALKAREGQA